MKKNFVLYTVLFLGLTLFVAVGIASAQSNERGAINGAVYRDINGDGVCVNTGVEGEVPVAGVPIEFVSSDEAVVINLETGEVTDVRPLYVMYMPYATTESTGLSSQAPMEGAPWLMDAGLPWAHIMYSPGN